MMRRNGQRAGASAYLFDMDGVIVDNTPYHVRSWAAYSRELGNELPVERILQLLGQTNEGYLTAVLGRRPTEAEVAAAVDRKEALYRDLIRPDLHKAMTPGLVEFLCQAERDGIPCAIVTGGPPENVGFVVDDLPDAPSRQLVADLLDLGFGLMWEGLPAIARAPEAGFLAAFALFPLATLSPADFPNAFDKFAAFATALADRLDAESSAPPAASAPDAGPSPAPEEISGGFPLLQV